MTLYEILGLYPDATEEEIKDAYRRKSMIHHPDREGGDEETFKQVKAAYEVLSDPERRKRYDETGQTEEGPSEEEMLANAATHILVETLNSIPEWVTPTQDDFIERMVKRVDSRINKLERDVALGESALSKVRKLLGRFIKKDKGRNVFQDHLEREVANIETFLVEGARRIALEKKLREYIQSYQFIVDPNAEKESEDFSIWKAIAPIKHTDTKG